jgi:hypothetical protein
MSAGLTQLIWSLALMTLIKNLGRHTARGVPRALRQRSSRVLPPAAPTPAAGGACAEPAEPPAEHLLCSPLTS